MSDALPSATCCVYRIRCMASGKFYVGSTVNLRERWKVHRRSLRAGVHHSERLQRAWNKHGETAFALEVLEIVERSGLLAAEQQWIDGSGCTDARKGFNVSRLASNGTETIPAVWPGFRDPDGNPVTIVNLHRFCREHGFDFPSMHRLARGRSKLKSYKGWTHEKSIRQREHVKTHPGYISPDGSPHPPIVNLASFCRSHGLEKSHMVALARGRLCSHRGWTHVNARKRVSPRILTGFVAPEGVRVWITNLSRFCSENGLTYVHMQQVKAGVRRTHKGWTWKDPA